MKYDKFTVEKVKTGADIRDFIPGCTRKADQMVDCPFCGSKKMSVVHKANKNFAICHVCNKGFSNAIDAIMHFEHLDFIPALEAVASRSNIVIIPEQDAKDGAVKSASSVSTKSFYRQQLIGSGLTEEDIVAKVQDKDGHEDWVVPFKKGGIDPPFRPNFSSDEMLIFYYALDGRPKQYVPKGERGRPLPYFRVRWSNPSLHTDSDGKEMKYKTPAGAPSQAYIPQKIRELYQAKAHIETLFVQEGEKKAEKACKHGIPSIGIQGINNFGTAQDGLLQDIQDLAKVCSVRNVVLMMDSDWDDLHRNIVVGDSVDKRPNSFSKAVIKFKQFVGTLHNIGLSVDVWWGHINDNELHDKGIDDLLCNSLSGKESELADDISKAMFSHNGVGTWVTIHKISAVTDRQIQDYWLLNDDQAFYNRHADRLEGIETFKIRRIRYRVEEGVLIQVNRYSSDVDIYSIERDKNEQEKVVFNMVETIEFLTANGFFRLRTTASDGTSSFEYIHIDDGIIDKTTGVDVRDFIRDYLKSTCRKRNVKEFFANRIDSLLADKKLENLSPIDNDFNKFTPDVQKLFYNNGQVEITSHDIVPMKPMCNVWRNRIVPRSFRRVPVISSIDKIEDSYSVEVTPEGNNCEFLRYLYNASNTFYTHDTVRDLTPSEEAQLAQGLVNKITTIGYLLCDYKFSSERKAVVIQDYLMSEVGQSNGGAGKSILGNALGKVTNQLFIDGKQEDSDRFIFERVNLSTRNIFIDDVRTNYNFERLFPMVTGDMIIPRKNIGALEIPVAESPKILITTNHAINKADEGATRRRITYMEFSPWYNPDHTVVDDFNHMFFDDWDSEQWNLFDNFMAECVMYYLRSFEQEWYRKGQGAVPPPMKNIMLRTLRQEMSEVLYTWAEEYFDESGKFLNERIVKKDMYLNFMDYAGNTKHSVSSSNFRLKIIAYCKFKGYDFNVNKKNASGISYSDWKPEHLDETFIGEADKSGGIEYFTVYSPEKESKMKPF